MMGHVLVEMDLEESKEVKNVRSVLMIVRFAISQMNANNVCQIRNI